MSKINVSAKLEDEELIELVVISLCPDVSNLEWKKVFPVIL